MWFNRICQSKGLKADCAEIKINSNSTRAHKTKEQFNIYRIKMKVSLHQKQTLTEPLYKLHLINSKYWQCNWNFILDSINNKLTEEMKGHNP
jgi:hypothetical protein